MSRLWQGLATAVCVAAMLAAATANAQESWNPFREKDEAVRRPKRQPEPSPPPLQPMNGAYPQSSAPRRTPGSPEAPEPGFGAAYPGTEPAPSYARPVPSPYSEPQAQPASAMKVERLELEPAMTGDGSGMPQDAWRGMTIEALEESLGSLALPPRSPALHALWSRLMAASADAPQGGRSPAHFDAIRLEALYRAGLLGAMEKRLQGVSTDDPVFQSFRIRLDLALGRHEQACQTARALMSRRASLPKPMIGELHLLAGYCAAAEGNQGGAGVAADLAREEGVDAPVALASLEALAGNAKSPLTPPKTVRVLDYRLLELLGPVEPDQVLDRAEPALAAAVAMQENADPRARVAAAETAARLNALTAEQLAAAYRAAPAGADEPMLRRGEQVRAIAAEQSPGRKLQLAKVLLDDARRNGLLLPVASVLAPAVTEMRPAPEIQPYADTLIEIAIASGDIRRAREIGVATGARQWVPVIDLADPGVDEATRERNLAALDDVVRRGRFAPDLLHRLATVLDATDVNVPIPLWEAASRTPQPSTGYLPETGVLAQLQEAAKRKEVARTVLLSMRALGPAGPDGAHIIALGDSIRALRRVGLDREARALGVEALLTGWPRAGGS